MQTLNVLFACGKRAQKYRVLGRMQATLVILMIWKMFWWQSFDTAIHVAVPLYSLNAAIDWISKIPVSLSIHIDMVQTLDLLRSQIRNNTT